MSKKQHMKNEESEEKKQDSIKDTSDTKSPNAMNDQLMDKLMEAQKWIERARAVLEPFDFSVGSDAVTEHFYRLMSSTRGLSMELKEQERWFALSDLEKTLKEHVQTIEYINVSVDFASDDQGGGDYYFYVHIEPKELEEDSEIEPLEASQIEQMQDQLADMMSVFNAYEFGDVTFSLETMEQVQKNVMGEKEYAERQLRILKQSLGESEPPRLVNIRRM